MNQEEFDKRLSESFRNENLPPDTRLWQNINSRLNENSKRPFWFWLIPVVLVVALAGWLINLPQTDRTTNQSSIATVVEKNEAVVLNSETSKPVNDKTSNVAPVNGNDPVTTVNVPNVETTNLNIRQNKQGHTSNNNQDNNGSVSNPHKEDGNVFLTDYFQPTVEPVATDLFPTFLRMKHLISPAVPEYKLAKEEPIAFESPFKDRKVYKSPYSKNPVNYGSKWWFSFGLGPQVAFNKAIVPPDSQKWVHKDLWSNSKKLTRNGSGFQSQILLGRKLGKHFSIESGIQYSFHSEDIKFNFNSYDIEHRDSNNMIDRYLKLKIAIWVGLDTTYYDAVRGFSLAVKNKYSIITIPVKFNFEHQLSDKTKIVAGLGAGLSAITTKKSTHLNLINDHENIQKGVHQFTASINGQIALYTNFNDIGLLGIYSGFQMYTKPWELSNKQYGIKMSDLQLGISFRRPLNW